MYQSPDLSFLISCPKLQDNHFQPSNSFWHLQISNILTLCSCALDPPTLDDECWALTMKLAFYTVSSGYLLLIFPA